MKKSVKPQLTLKDTDMELIGKMALAQKQDLNKTKVETVEKPKKKARKKSGDSYISPDDGIPNKHI